MEAEVDPGALTIMAKADAELAAIGTGTTDDELARVEAGAATLAERRAHDQAERARAAIEEPVIAGADAGPDLEVTAAIGRAEPTSGADLEI